MKTQDNIKIIRWYHAVTHDTVMNEIASLAWSKNESIARRDGLKHLSRWVMNIKRRYPNNRYQLTRAANMESRFYVTYYDIPVKDDSKP